MMRISNNFEITNFSNKLEHKTLADSPLILYFSEPKNNYHSYFDSEKYLELKDLCQKYDLSNKNCGVIENPELNFAINSRKNFVKEYGKIKSDSMQELVLDKNSPNFDKTLMQRINNMRKNCRSFSPKVYLEKLSKEVKLKKIGNCTDVSAVSINEMNKMNSNCKGELVYATILKDEVFYNHAAVLVDSKKDSKLDKHSIILDNWLGGVFEYKDWIKIISKLYKTNAINCYVDKSQL